MLFQAKDTVCWWEVKTVCKLVSSSSIKRDIDVGERVVSGDWKMTVFIYEKGISIRNVERCAVDHQFSVAGSNQSKNVFIGEAIYGLNCCLLIDEVRAYKVAGYYFVIFTNIVFFGNNRTYRFLCNNSSVYTTMLREFKIICGSRMQGLYDSNVLRYYRRFNNGRFRLRLV